MATQRTPDQGRNTRQRAAVLDALQQAPEPLSAQDLHAQLRRSVGLATVYRALQGLVESGQVDVFRRESGEALFRLCNPVHHHHLVCQCCGRVEEIDACEVEPWAARVARRRGFTLSGHQADIFGLCPRCQDQPGS
ncbi:MAG TPA: Fur family transcriptional regulator [Actinomycetes bacterium]|jgi:Fur family ferric uptake transcriptional regulator|nr:Fur family transcriptional regulator [Actinomycetes bacterium]